LSNSNVRKGLLPYCITRRYLTLMTYGRIGNIKHCKLLGIDVVEDSETSLVLVLPYSKNARSLVGTQPLTGGALLCCHLNFQRLLALKLHSSKRALV
jgi:hypothetical protein